MGDAVVVAGSIITLLGALAAIGAGGRWMWRTVRMLTRFLDEAMGEPAAFGRPARPGFLERIATIESKIETIEDGITKVHQQVVPNGGGSMRDAVTRIEEQIINGGKP